MRGCLLWQTWFNDIHGTEGFFNTRNRSSPCWDHFCWHHLTQSNFCWVGLKKRALQPSLPPFFCRQNWFLIILFFKIGGFVLRVGSSFLDPKILACMHPCHTWNLRTSDLCEVVVSPNFLALNNWDCIDRPQVTCNLGLGTPCELAYDKGEPTSSYRWTTWV
jgi:hypothetical protein